MDVTGKTTIMYGRGLMQLGDHWQLKWCDVWVVTVGSLFFIFLPDYDMAKRKYMAQTWCNSFRLAKSSTKHALSLSGYMTNKAPRELQQMHNMVFHNCMLELDEEILSSTANFSLFLNDIRPSQEDCVLSRWSEEDFWTWFPLHSPVSLSSAICHETSAEHRG